MNSELSILQDINNMTPLNAALTYASLGWPVFPCNGKIPLVSGGFKSASKNPEQIKQWWTRTPEANIGLPTGQISGLVALDVDLKHDGFKSLDGFANADSIFTLSAQTGGGGRHFFFRHTGQHIATNAGKLAPGLDIRGDGGYVIVSPSRHDSGKKYQWLNDHSVSVIPTWMGTNQELETPNKIQSQSNKSGVRNPLIHEGTRNNELAKYAGKLRREGHSLDFVLEALRDKNSACCNPPLYEDEVRRIAESICSYEPDPFASARVSESDKTLALTDIGNGQRLVSRFGHEIRYIPQIDKWTVYETGKWKLEDKMQVTTMAKAVAKEILVEAYNSSPKLAQEVSLWATKSQDERRVAAMIKMARSEPEVCTTLDGFDLGLYDLNLLNGTLDLRTGKLRPHNPADLITKQTPIFFDKTADCPKWKKFIHEVMLGNVELVQYLQKVMGYSLTGITTEQVFFIFHGNGSNGKSVFLEIMSELAGEYGQTTDFSTFLAQTKQGPRDDLACLDGKRFVSGSEIGFGKHLDETVVKQVTGNDKISARHLYGRYFTFTPRFKLFLATNHKPRIRGDENGMWRRVRIIPWEATFRADQVNPNLLDELREELAGILNWAIEGCLKWQSEGLGLPAKVKEAIEEYRQESDHVTQFVTDSCMKDDNTKIAASELFRAYVEWCEESSVDPMSQTSFGTRMTGLGFEKKKVGTYYRMGIRLKTSWE